MQLLGDILHLLVISAWKQVSMSVPYYSCMFDLWSGSQLSLHLTHGMMSRGCSMHWHDNHKAIRLGTVISYTSSHTIMSRICVWDLPYLCGPQMQQRGYASTFDGCHSCHFLFDSLRKWNEYCWCKRRGLGWRGKFDGVTQNKTCSIIYLITLNLMCPVDVPSSTCIRLVSAGQFRKSTLGLV